MYRYLIKEITGKFTQELLWCQKLKNANFKGKYKMRIKNKDILSLFYGLLEKVNGKMF